MDVFVDTSAFYALFDQGDDFHTHAQKIALELINNNVNLITSNYVLVETIALLQNRLNLAASRDFIEQIIPLYSTVWINEQIHTNGIKRFINEKKKKLSFVDCTSFEIMEMYDIKKAFTFDKHFKGLIPSNLA